MAEPRRKDEPAKGPRTKANRPEPWPHDPKRKPGTTEARPEGRGEPGTRPGTEPRHTDAPKPEEGLNVENPTPVEGTHEDEPHPEPPHPPEDAAWDYREPAEKVEAHQETDSPPTPRGHRYPPESKVGPGEAGRPTEGAHPADPGETPDRGAWAGMPTGRGGRRHPLGITLIAVLLGINGITSLGMLLVVLVGGGEMLMAPTPETAGVTGATEAMGTGTAILYLGIAAIINLALLYGLWTWRKWGYWGVVAVAAVATLWSLIGAFATPAAAGVLGDAVSVLIGLVILWYMLRPRVKALFE